MANRFTKFKLEIRNLFLTNSVFYFNVFLCAKDDEEIDPMLEQYKDFLFAPDELPVYVAAPKASQMSNH